MNAFNSRSFRRCGGYWMAGAAGALVLAVASAQQPSTLSTTPPAAPVAPNVAAPQPVPPPPAPAPLESAPAFSNGVADVVKMLDAGVSREIVLAYAQNSPVPYRLGANEIIALKDRGVPADILTALIVRGGEVRGQSIAGAMPPQPVNPGLAWPGGPESQPQPPAYGPQESPYPYEYPTQPAYYGEPYNYAPACSYPAYYYPSYYSYYPYYPYYPSYSLWWWSNPWFYRSYAHYGYGRGFHSYNHYANFNHNGGYHGFHSGAPYRSPGFSHPGGFGRPGGFGHPGGFARPGGSVGRPVAAPVRGGGGGGGFRGGGGMSHGHGGRA